MASDGDWGPTWSGKWCHCLDQGKGPVAAGAVEGGVYRADSHSGEGTPGGMLNRVDIGAFPSNRWYGVTIMPWPSGGLALRAVPQAVRKARWFFPSSSIASNSRCWISLASNCWVEWALEAPLDSASLMVVEQQFSSSAKAREQSSSISLRQAACQTLASLTSTVQQVSSS